MLFLFIFLLLLLIFFSKGIFPLKTVTFSLSTKEFLRGLKLKEIFALKVLFSRIEGMEENQ
jgi:hypothetical protein